MDFRDAELAGKQIVEMLYKAEVAKGLIALATWLASLSASRCGKSRAPRTALPELVPRVVRYSEEDQCRIESSSCGFAGSRSLRWSVAAAPTRRSHQPTNLPSSIDCTGPRESRNLAVPNCLPKPKYEFDLSGVWTISDCTYYESSSEFAFMSGQPCAGSIQLCPSATAPGGWTTMKYLDQGPNGTGIGNGFDSYVTSCKNCDGTGGVSTSPDSFEVFGTDIVMSQGCTSSIDVVFVCAGGGNSLWTCRKWSGIRSSSCSGQPTTGWVESFGHYSHASTTCL